MSLESKSKEELIKLCRELQEELSDFKTNSVKKLYLALDKQISNIANQVDNAKIDIVKDEKLANLIITWAQNGVKLKLSMDAMVLSEKEIKEQNKDFSLEKLRKNS